jgi:hypothetical protein
MSEHEYGDDIVFDFLEMAKEDDFPFKGKTSALNPELMYAEVKLRTHLAAFAQRIHKKSGAMTINMAATQNSEDYHFYGDVTYEGHALKYAIRVEFKRGSVDCAASFGPGNTANHAFVDSDVSKQIASAFDWAAGIVNTWDATFDEVIVDVQRIEDEACELDDD